MEEYNIWKPKSPHTTPPRIGGGHRSLGRPRRSGRLRRKLGSGPEANTLTVPKECDGCGDGAACESATQFDGPRPEVTGSSSSDRHWEPLCRRRHSLHHRYAADDRPRRAGAPDTCYLGPPLNTVLCTRPAVRVWHFGLPCVCSPMTNSVTRGGGG